MNYFKFNIVTFLKKYLGTNRFHCSADARDSSVKSGKRSLEDDDDDDDNTMEQGKILNLYSIYVMLSFVYVILYVTVYNFFYLVKVPLMFFCK